MEISQFYRALVSDPEPEIHAGGSGYFSRPDKGLDPHLFNGGQLKPEVRKFILDTLYGYWGHKYHAPRKWSTVWIAGSGVSYQWAADRSNGDLDILIGVNFAEFDRANPDFSGLSESSLADRFNVEFHQELWPKTATTNLNGQTYEVTFYCNPGAQDIRAIHPYAAYNVTTDDWTVKPPVLPDDPATLYPDTYYKAAESEAKYAKKLVARYHTQRAQALAMPEHSPGNLNALAAAEATVAQAKALFDSIHLGRKQAFSGTGEGYGDYYNFRWQYHKREGTVQALHSLATVQTEAQEATETELYGQPLKSPTALLTEAILRDRVRT